MILRSALCSSLVLISFIVFAQKGIITGTIKDNTIGEPLIGATVLIGKGVGTITDLDGKFSIQADYGKYTLIISYVGFQPVSQTITLDRKLLRLKDFKLETTTLSEVEVIADVAIDRETPVAFTTILPAKIEEELASQDLPMILNSTPGVYATQQGGGDGDARITIRGFNQRNVAVMIDGIPVNDMENGWVYWSNWFGLDAVTRSIQVQRGLGASKIAIPSIGGTMNILTKGIDNKKSISIKQEVRSDGYYRTSVGYNSGRLDNGWGYTFAGSFKRGDGWADQTFTKGWFYFGKVEKMAGKHMLSLNAMGAPQKHGQRSFKQPIATFNSNFASKYIENKYIDTLLYKDLGLTYNPNWGYLERYTITTNGDTFHTEQEIVNEKMNYYHKPQFSLKDFWAINDNLYLSNMLYLSIGRGGGTGNTATFPTTPDGQVNYQSIYDAILDTAFFKNYYETGEIVSSNILRSSINNHIWYGFLSTFNYSINDTFNISGGADFRYYKGVHYRTVYDLFGGDIYFNGNDQNQRNGLKKVGDKIDYYNDGLVKWSGLFAQVEYKTGLISAFLNVSGAYTGYKRIDYFKRKDLVLTDTLVKEAVGYAEVYYHGPDSVPYYSESPEARYSQTDWKWIPGFTLKTGANYNINEHYNVFLNLGYLSKAPRLNNVISRGNQFFMEIKNEIIKAIEIGYGLRYNRFVANLNGYYTHWNNKPVDYPPTVPSKDDPDIRLPVNINGISALHKGIELDFAYKLTSNFTFEGLASLGDWVWDSGDSVPVFDELGNLDQTVIFDATGVHVGDAAQSQYAASLRYEIKNKLVFKNNRLYLKGKFTFFGRHYANFDPISLDPTKNPYAFDGEGKPRESWLIPNYYTVDFHTGYGFRINTIRINLKFSILNALNTIYVSDAQNNSQYIPGNYNDFDAKSAAVFLGLGRRFYSSLKITL
ncbi:TonB-dependent receptor [bacterium AH-315-M05]|nr:TonB-dependent receptor [bacterium AH-315-M05]MBN4051207.1 TonB-dependent receptor [bacterium AH-315-M05]